MPIIDQDAIDVQKRLYKLARSVGDDQIEQLCLELYFDIGVSDLINEPVNLMHEERTGRIKYAKELLASYGA